MNKKLISKLLSLLIAVTILLPMGLPGTVFAAEDGTMEFVDECEDFSKVYSKTGCLEVDTDHPERYYNNDTSRFMRSIAARSGDNLAQYVIYKVPGRITDIDINTAICGGGPFDFKFFLSGNGRDFTELPVERDEPGKGDNWSFVFYRANGLTGSEQYLKILWTGTDPNGQWAEQVNRVVINYKRDTSLSGVAMYNPDYTDTTPADVTGLNSKSDIRTVCGLGLLEKNELGNFKPNDLIIRKEFLTAVCKMFGLMPLDKTSPEEPGDLLKIQGYIDEDADETSNILYEDAVEILVKALGYGDAVKADTSAEYIKKASNLKLLNNVEGGSGDNITRENAAVLLANALNAYLTEAGPDDASRSKNVYRIFTDKGVWMNFESEEYLKINDKRVKNADVVQMLKESCVEYDPVKSPDSIGQLIKYHMDTEGNIKSIYIVKPENDWVKQGIDYNNRPVVNDQLVRTFYKEQPKFYTSNYCFYFTDSNKAINFFATDDNTVIFHIPGREYDPNDMGEEHYKVLDRKSMGDYRYMWTDFYNVDRFGNIGAVVSRDSNRNEIYPAEGVYMIEDTVKGVNDKLDETAVKLTVRSAMSASHPQQELYVSPDAEIVKIDKRASVDPKSQGVFTKFDFGDVGAGDIVQFKFDAYNRIRYIYLWADASMLISNPNYTAFLSNGGDVGGEVAVAYGSVKELNLQKQIVNIETRVDMSDEGTNTTMHCLGSLLQNVFIVECKNGKPNSVSRSTLSGIAEGDKVVVYFMKQYPSTIVVMRNF